MKFLSAIVTLSLISSVQGSNLEALKLALDDEYKAASTYEKVIENFGDVRPFRNILAAEKSHIEALIPFFHKYGEEVPPNPYGGNVPSFDTLKEACVAGVEGEVLNVELYDQIYDLVDDEELVKVFNRLQWASQERHLPAFKRCAR